MARRLGPAQPLGITWNGAGAWLIFSQSRQVNFSRTCWITFHWRGIDSSVSVTSSPNLRLLRRWAAAQVGRRCHRDAGIYPAPMEGDPARPREVHLPGL